MITPILKTILLITLGTCVILMSGCSCKPILYKPTADPIPILMSINVPEVITSVSLVPRDRYYIEKGIVKESGKRHQEIDEWIELTKTDGSSLRTQYRILLYRDEETARKGYEFLKKGTAPLHFQPFREHEDKQFAYHFTYINRPRSSVEGFCRPMDYYESQIVLRLRNLVASIDCHHKDVSSDLLVSSVKYFAEQLEKSMKISE